MRGGYSFRIKYLFHKETSVFVVNEDGNSISDDKQITYILTEDQIGIPVHFRFLECSC